MIKIKLPFWMNKGELEKIAHLFEKWWDKVMQLIKYPLVVTLITVDRDRIKAEHLLVNRVKPKAQKKN